MLRRPTPAVLAALAALTLIVGACSSDPGERTTTGAATSSTTAPDRSSTTTTTSTPDAPVTADGAQRYVDTLADALASGAAGGLPVDAAAARCLAPRWVETLGDRRLVDGGVTPEELASGYGADTSKALDAIIGTSEAEAMVAAFGACDVDVERVFVDALAAGHTLTDTEQECLVEAFPDGFVERALVLGLSEGDGALEANIELNDTLTAAARECIG